MSRQTSDPLPARPLTLAERVSRQNGVTAHFHDHDDDWMDEAENFPRPRDDARFPRRGSPPAVP